MRTRALLTSKTQPNVLTLSRGSVAKHCTTCSLHQGLITGRGVRNKGSGLLHRAIPFPERPPSKKARPDFQTSQLALETPERLPSSPSRHPSGHPARKIARTFRPASSPSRRPSGHPARPRDTRAAPQLALETPERPPSEKARPDFQTSQLALKTPCCASERLQRPMRACLSHLNPATLLVQRELRTRQLETVLEGRIS